MPRVEQELGPLAKLLGSKARIKLWGYTFFPGSSHNWIMHDHVNFVS